MQKCGGDEEHEPISEEAAEGIRWGEEEPNVLVKLGGLPDWIQYNEHPICPECNDMMMFVGQLNSDDQLRSGHNVLMFGDNGRLFTFICCRTVTNIMQCY